MNRYAVLKLPTNGSGVLDPECHLDDLNVEYTMLDGTPHDNIECRSGYSENLQIAVADGVFAYLLKFADEMIVETRNLRSFLYNPTYRRNAMAQAVSFYGAFPGCEDITEADTTALLLMHVYGGGPKKWFEELQNGVFTYNDGTVMSTTMPKRVLTNNTKTVAPNGCVVWPRPAMLCAVCNDITRVVRAVVSRNDKWPEIVEATAGYHEYRRTNFAIAYILSWCQAFYMHDLARGVFAAANGSVRIVSIGPNMLEVEVSGNNPLLRCLPACVVHSYFPKLESPKLPEPEVQPSCFAFWKSKAKCV